MTLNKPITPIAAAALTLLLVTSPTRAQHVLVCFTLHNDLANYDRRARSVDGYSKSTFEAEFEAAAPPAAKMHLRCPAAGDPTSRRESCELKRQQAIKRKAEFHRLLWLHSDPVRQRIIAEMRRNRCPLDAPVID